LAGVRRTSDQTDHQGNKHQPEQALGDATGAQRRAGGLPPAHNGTETMSTDYRTATAKTAKVRSHRLAG
jgi:hypothetical protein